MRKCLQNVLTAETQKKSKKYVTWCLRTAWLRWLRWSGLLLFRSAFLTPGALVSVFTVLHFLLLNNNKISFDKFSFSLLFYFPQRIQEEYGFIEKIIVEYKILLSYSLV